MSVRVARNARKFRGPADVLEIRVESFQMDADRRVAAMLRAAYLEARRDGIRPSPARVVAIGVVVVHWSIVGAVSVDRAERWGLARAGAA